ncbi:MAG: flagellar hook-length control protein FliK [Planctomycetia bacterium]|nr:flagellar hook-length control protein FliK [Planctomycetia bacterium]
MKIAARLTNATPGETGLPSLLSCGPNAAPSSIDDLSIPAESRKTDPTQVGQSVTAFDAVLAMFNVSQNLPQQLQPTMTASKSDIIATAPAASLDVTSDVVNQTPMADVSLARSPQIVASAVAPLIASTATSLPTVVESQSVNSPTASLGQSQIPNPTPAASVDSTTVPTSESTPTTEPSEPIAATQNSLTLESTAFVETSNSATTLDGSAQMPLTVTVETKATLPRPVSEPRSQRAAPIVSPAYTDSNSGAVTTVREEPSTLFGTLTTGSNTLLMRDFPKSFPRFLDARRDVLGEEGLRHRHETANSRTVADLVGSTNPASEPTDHGVRQVDVSHMADQVSAVMQTHGQELAAGQPVEVHLRLDPPELGMVRVHLRMNDDAVSIRFIAGDEAVTKLLESQLPDLRQSLAERGLEFAQCNVSCDSRQQQSSNSHRENDSSMFAATPVATRSWSRPAFVTRSLNTGSGRIDILA